MSSGRPARDFWATWACGLAVGVGLALVSSGVSGLADLSSSPAPASEFERAELDAWRREQAAAGRHDPAACPQRRYTCPHVPSLESSHR